MKAPMTAPASTSPRLLPLLTATDLGAPLAWCGGQPVSAARFIAEAQWLAEQLPAQGRAVNLCQDRYHFALGLAAALLRGHTSLMPPNALPQTLGQLRESGGGLATRPPCPPYLLHDDPGLDGGGLPLYPVARPAPEAAGSACLAPATQVPCIPAELDAVCLLTSGSTGAPQPHAKSWGALSANIAAAAERLAQSLGRPNLAGLNLVATVPAQHSYGLESSVLLALLGGASFDAGRPFYPADIAAALVSVPVPRALVTTPFHLKTLLRSGLTLPPTELLLSATAPLSPQLAAEAEAATGGALIEIYGCTEAGQLATRRTSQSDTWTTLGALHISHQPQTQAAAEGFMVAGGHVPVPTLLADVLALQDAHHFRLLGRANDLIHVAGKRSSLAHLNFHLNRIEGVQDGAFWLPEAGAAGDGDAAGVARTVAFVVAPGLSARDLVAALRPHIEAAFLPRRVIQVPALPREATGKLGALALRRFAERWLAAADAGHSVPIDPAHPVFAGHFPGRPLLPGALILALVQEALQADAELHQRLGPAPQIDSARFLAPVGPGAQLRITLVAQRAGAAFEVHEGATLVARGQLSPGPAGAA
jgi:hypothetical protein